MTGLLRSAWDAIRLHLVGAWASETSVRRVLLVTGLAMVTGRLTTFGYWPLETFPALGRIG